MLLEIYNVREPVALLNQRRQKNFENLAFIRILLITNILYAFCFD